MTILDPYAVLAWLKGEPAAADVERLVRSEAGARLTAVGVGEVLDQLIRNVGVPEEEAALGVAQLDLGEPVPVGAILGMHAGLLRARHYHRAQPRRQPGRLRRRGGGQGTGRWRRERRPAPARPLP